MEVLTRLDENHVPKEGVAEDWDISDDGLEYTFYLNEDAKWSNGDPVVAADFEYAWKYMLDPDTASEAAFLAYFMDVGGNLMRVKAVLMMSLLKPLMSIH